MSPHQESFPSWHCNFLKLIFLSPTNYYRHSVTRPLNKYDILSPHPESFPWAGPATFLDLTFMGLPINYPKKSSSKRHIMIKYYIFLSSFSSLISHFSLELTSIFFVNIQKSSKCSRYEKAGKRLQNAL